MAFLEDLASKIATALRGVCSNNCIHFSKGGCESRAGNSAYQKQGRRDDRLGVDIRTLSLTHKPIAQVYTLTHEIFVAFEYGLGEGIDLHTVYTPEDLAYLGEVLPALAETWIAKADPDAVAEIVECMQYVQLEGTPLYRRAVDYLIDDANPDGSWGHYGTSERAKMRHYLHTVGVVLQSLFFEFYGPMPLK